MRQSEMRSGNYVHIVDRSKEVHLPATGVLFRVVTIDIMSVELVLCGINQTAADLKRFPISDISPVSLTPEILEKSEFAKGNFKQAGYYKDPFFIYLPGGPSFGYGFGVKGAGLIRSIKYLHQLQNLVFDLSDEELIYTP